MFDPVNHMKRFLLLIAIASSCVAMANERSEQEKQSIAINQLTGLNAKARAFGNQHLSVNKVVSADAYSVYTPQEGAGFVVVSNDDAFTPVLGYSSSEFNSDDMPDGLKWWFGAINNSLKDGNNRKARTRGDKYTPVENFVLSTWGQGKPYNALVPMAGMKKSVTGCVATAMAQILNYYKYPEKSSGVGSYSLDGGQSTTNVDMSTTFMWDQILDTYNPNHSYSDEEKRPIGELMRDCGFSCHMDYSSDGSSAAISEAAIGMVRNFGFNQAYLYHYMRDFYSQEGWMSMIYKELSARRPILYAAFDENNGGGHAFIFSGIDSEGRVYVNWGWDGTGNGYYDISDLAPTGNGSYHFNLSQRMLIGITPYPEEAGLLPKYSEICISENYVIEALVALNNRIAVRTGTIVNLSQIFFKGVIDMVLVNEAGEQYTYNFLKFEDEGIAYGYGRDGKNKYISVTDLPAGTYIAYLASKAEKDTYYQPVKCEGLGAIGYKIIKHEDGSLEDFPGQTVNIDGVVTAIKPVEMQNTGLTKSSKYIYDLNGRNMGTDPSVLPKGVFIMNGRKVVK
jgi:hypothetical protein